MYLVHDRLTVRHGDALASTPRPGCGRRPWFQAQRAKTQLLRVVVEYASPYEFAASFIEGLSQIRKRSKCRVRSFWDLPENKGPAREETKRSLRTIDWLSSSNSGRSCAWSEGTNSTVSLQRASALDLQSSGAFDGGAKLRGEDCG